MNFNDSTPIQRRFYPSQAAYRGARNEHLVALSRLGFTLQAMGEIYGITREMVRQVLDAAGVSGEDRRKVRRQRAESSREADRDSILSWAQANPGHTRQEAAVALGMTLSQLHAAIGAEGGALFLRPPASIERVYSEAAIIRHLEAAAAVMGNPLSKNDYEAYVEAHGGISSMRILQRFGGRWNAACLAAGLKTNAPLRRVYTRRWSAADLVLHVVDYLESDDATGSYADYGRWARLAASRPSSQTVRNYLGPWADAKRFALTEQARLRHDYLANSA